jgi:hypothetical protein
MPNFTIYGQPYYEGRQLINPNITINASRPYAFYKPYNYFEVHSSDKPMPLAKHAAYDKSSADEWLSRARRTVLFSNSTQLAPAKFNRVKYGNMIDRAYKAIHCDHVTCWVSPLGTRFILNEPYFDDPNYLLKLRERGLVGVVVPTDLSAYCGGWNENLGSKPGTTTYLICDISDARELAQLLSTLGSATVAPWNCVKGINHA